MIQDPKELEQHFESIRDQIKADIVTNFERKTGRQVSIAKDSAGSFKGKANAFNGEERRYGEVIAALLAPLRAEQSQNWLVRQKFSTSFFEYTGITAEAVDGGCHIVGYFSAR